MKNGKHQGIFFPRSIGMQEDLPSESLRLPDSAFSNASFRRYNSVSGSFQESLQPVRTLHSEIQPLKDQQLLSGQNFCIPVRHSPVPARCRELFQDTDKFRFPDQPPPLPVQLHCTTGIPHYLDGFDTGNILKKPPAGLVYMSIPFLCISSRLQYLDLLFL